MSFQRILKFLLIWRMLLFVVALIGAFLIPLQKDYLYKEGVGVLDNILSPWASFDGVHYLNLASHWYANFYTLHLYAFFPVYPWLIRNLNLFDNHLYTSLFLSHIFLLSAIYFLYKLLRLDVSDKLAKLTIFLMLIFPTSFFYVSTYTESLFLFLTVACFYFALKRNFLLSAVFAMIASATRLSGIFLWPALIVEYLDFYKFDFKKAIKDSKLGYLLLPPLGLLSYMDYQFNKTGDFLFFIHSQPAFGANRVIDKLVLLHQVFYRYVRMVITVENKLQPMFFVVLLEFGCGLLFLFLIIAAFRSLRKSYLVYSLFSFIVPTLTGTLSSIPRYVLVLFPLFLMAAQLLNNRSKSIKYLVGSISLALLTISLMLFTRGYFVS